MSEYVAAADLFGNYRLIKPGGTAVDERSIKIGALAALMGTTSKRAGIRLSHYSLSDLRYLISDYNERANNPRQGSEKARKWLWWVTKTRTVDNPVAG